jgi:hypothetical protein
LIVCRTEIAARLAARIQSCCMMAANKTAVLGATGYSA